MFCREITDPAGDWPRHRRVRLGRHRRADSLEISYAGSHKNILVYSRKMVERPFDSCFMLWYSNSVVNDVFQFSLLT